MAHILELPYQGEDISMFILLPPFSKEDGIEQVLKRLTLENFKSVVNGSLLPRQVQVSLPKFTLEQTIELTPVSVSLGSFWHVRQWWWILIDCLRHAALGIYDFEPNVVTCLNTTSTINTFPPIPYTVVNKCFLPSGDGLSFPPLDT